jgi:hypothetical protein
VAACSANFAVVLLGQRFELCLLWPCSWFVAVVPLPVLSAVPVFSGDVVVFLATSLVVFQRVVVLLM